MSGSITWRGGAGRAWATAQNWSGFKVPDGSDQAVIGIGGTAEIGRGVVASVGALVLPDGTLLVDSGGVLRVAGTIALAGGTLALAGRLTGGVVLGEGGTLDGTVVQGGVCGLGDLTITVATAAANAGQPIAPQGTLTLAGGHYHAATFRLDPSAAIGGVVELAAAAGPGVVLDGASRIVGGGTPLAPAIAVLGGGTITNQGSIVLTPATTLETQVFYQPTGKFHSLVASALTWTQSVAPTLDIAAVRFDNAGLVALAGGTLDLTGTQFGNAGCIRLSDATGETVQQDAVGLVAVVATPFASHVEVAASVMRFANDGTISADTIGFDGAVSLGQLGALAGKLSFAGTLDLGGGALTATAAAPVAITGIVQSGKLNAGDGLLAFDNASLRGVTLASGIATADGTLHVLGLAGLTLGAGAVLSAGAGGDAVLLTGPSGGAIIDDGTIAAAAGATLTLNAGLAGAGTVELGDEAAVTVRTLALSATPTFLFDTGASLLSLPGAGAGVTLADLHARDVLDFRDISSVPLATGAKGTAFEIGNKLEVVGASGHAALLTLATPAHGIVFSVGSDGHGGTLVTVG